ncbi:MAG: O-antigen ligase family protein [Chloroflexi bacterium]|nr:O-antigen ligase family protein [Chloroflexota bacterium]
MRPDFATGHLLLWLGLYPLVILPLDLPWLQALAMVGLLTLFLVATFKQQNRPHSPTPIIAPFLLFYLLFALIAYVLSPLPAMSLPRLMILAGGVFGFYAVSAWLNSSFRLTLFLGGMALFGAALAVVGLFTMQWPERYVIDLRPLTNLLPHLSGDFSLNHNAMSGMLLILLPIALALAWQGVRYRGLFWLAAALMAFLLLLTQSRNAWLALLIGAAACFIWGRVRFIWVALLFATLALIPFTLNLWPQAIMARTQDQLSVIDTATKTGLPPPQSWLLRLEIWSVARQTIEDYPVWGTGLSTFVPVSRANYVFTELSPTFDFTHAHNLFLQTALSLGLAGVMALMGIWVGSLWGLWQPRPALTIAWSGWAAVLGAAAVAYLWFNLFDMLALDQRQGVIVWLLLAVVSRLHPEPASVVASPWLRVGQWSPVMLMVGLCLSPAASRNWHFLQLDEARFAGQVPANLPPAVAADKRRCGLYYFLEDDHEAALTAWKQSPQAALFVRGQGVLAFYAEQPEQAIEWYTLSLHLDFNPLTIPTIFSNFSKSIRPS